MPSLIIKTCLLSIFLLLPTVSGGVELFKWVDDRGVIHYSDKAPKKAKLKDITGSISSFKTVEVEAFDAGETENPAQFAAKSVVMYSTSWCGYCAKARKHFKRNNISFREYDIEKSKKAAREFKKLKGRGVPLILIGDRRMNGFSAARFDQIYN